MSWVRVMVANYLATSGAKNAFIGFCCAIFIPKNDQFAKTGSGQAQEMLRKEVVFAGKEWSDTFSIQNGGEWSPHFETHARTHASTHAACISF